MTAGDDGFFQGKFQNFQVIYAKLQLDMWSPGHVYISYFLQKL